MNISSYFVNLNSSYSSNSSHNGVQSYKNGAESLVKTSADVAGGSANATLDVNKQSQGFAISKGYSDNFQISSLTEDSGVNAKGIIKTDSGDITFSMNASLKSQNIQVTETRKLDPLVINLDGAGLPTFTDSKTNFDIDADGKMDSIASLSKGQAYLAMDSNNNSKIDNGSELIGTSSGGFNELKALDTNSDGFIDEKDAAYSKLKVFDPSNGSTKSLKEAGVGAIFVQSVANAYEYLLGGKDVAELTASSFAIGDSGKVMSLSQMDIAKGEEQAPQQQTPVNDDAQKQNPSSSITIESLTSESRSQSFKEAQAPKTSGFSESIKTQIKALQKEYDSLSAKANNASDIEDAKLLNARASIIKGQMMILQVSLFKLDSSSLNAVA